MVAQTRAAGNPSPRKLKFHEKIVGKGFSTDTLLKKLKTLHTELADLDQELVDVNSLGTARKELIHTTILLHKDRGVKAYAACCLADLLRLYAPDAPYTHHELRDIFQFFFRQLSTGLKGPDSPYYNEYFHLLESLSTVKSVVLVCDLPNAEELTMDIFRDFFGLVRHDLAKKIELFMADILVALIDECQTLPSEVLETIMMQFMDKHVVSVLFSALDYCVDRLSSSCLWDPCLDRFWQVSSCLHWLAGQLSARSVCECCLISSYCLGFTTLVVDIKPNHTGDGQSSISFGRSRLQCHG